MAETITVRVVRARMVDGVIRPPGYEFTAEAGSNWETSRDVEIIRPPAPPEKEKKTAPAK